MGTKQSFEKHANVTTVKITNPNTGAEIVLEDGTVYATDDPNVINDLASHPDVKTAETAKGKS